MAREAIKLKVFLATCIALDDSQTFHCTRKFSGCTSDRSIKSCQNLETYQFQYYVTAIQSHDRLVFIYFSKKETDSKKPQKSSSIELMNKTEYIYRKVKSITCMNIQSNVPIFHFIVAFL